MKKLLKKTRFAHIKKRDCLVFLGCFLFAWFLMTHTFSTGNGNINIATKVWSDFSATIPLIRSFSLGTNIPLEYPLFPGDHIKYHFLFFLGVGLIERAGFSLGFALNSLSIFAFASLLSLIYLSATYIFKNRVVGFFSIVLFLFNGSFSFLEFLNNHPFNLSFFSEIIHNTTFPSFGPYDGKIVSAFWNLNIYTNQRHLALAYSLFLLFSLFLYYYKENPKKLSYKKTILAGVLLGLLPFVHMAVFGMVVIALGSFFFFSKGIRLKIALIGLCAGLLSLPQLYYLRTGNQEINFIHIGYLAQPLDVWNFARYWFYNLGLVVILLPLGFVLANKRQRFFILPFFALFIVGNMFQFTPEIAANHKFFNLFTIGANMYCALVLYKLLSKKWSFVLGSALLILLTLSGIIDFFPIINDQKIPLADYPNNPTIEYIRKHTPPDSIFLNSTYLYTPSSLAGRKIFMGWPYFAWSAGYDTYNRDEILAQLWNPSSKEQACYFLKKEKIDYIEYHKTPSLEGITPNVTFYETNFVKKYTSPDGETTLYEVKASCDNLDKSFTNIVF